MPTRIALLFTASMVAVSALVAQTHTVIKEIPLTQTSPASGHEMFDTYCAVCHGKDGRGNGPAAAALKTSPTDLTKMAVRADGKYPEDRVVQVLASGPEIGAHGSAEMPIWGDLFRSLNAGRAELVRLRIVNITSYIKSIQR